MRALVAALAVVAVVGIGPTPPALGQETLFRVDELAAFDGTGKRLGALAPIVNAFRPTRVTVLFRVGAARPAPVDFSRDGFFAEPEVAFTTRDCTGQAYLQADVVSDGLDGLLRRAMPVGPRGTFYVQSGPGQWQRIRSELNTFTGRCRGNDYDARVAPAEPRGPDLADYVMPPYSAEPPSGRHCPRSRRTSRSRRPIASSSTTRPPRSSERPPTTSRGPGTPCTWRS